jgi:hypothetical protein
MDNTMVERHLWWSAAAGIDRFGFFEASIAADAEKPDWPTIACIPPAELLEHRNSIERAYRLANIADHVRHGKIGERSRGIALLAMEHSLTRKIDVELPAEPLVIDLFDDQRPSWRGYFFSCRCQHWPG